MYHGRYQSTVPPYVQLSFISFEYTLYTLNLVNINKQKYYGIWYENMRSFQYHLLIYVMYSTVQCTLVEVDRVEPARCTLIWQYICRLFSCFFRSFERALY